MFMLKDDANHAQDQAAQPVDIHAAKDLAAPAAYINSHNGPCIVAYAAPSLSAEVVAKLGPGALMYAVSVSGSWLQLTPAATLPTAWIPAVHPTLGVCVQRLPPPHPQKRPTLLPLRRTGQLLLKEYAPGHPALPVYIFEDFLSAAECEQLIAVARPLLKPSSTIANTGARDYKDARTSSNCSLPLQHAACIDVVERVSALARIPRVHMEPPQITRYLAGEKYDMHLDAVNPSTPHGRELTNPMRGGTRVGTALMYLNDVPRGGATEFSALEREVRPRRGRLVVFFPADLHGEQLIEAAHAALPAVDEKWVCQLWLRQFVANPLS